jgi:uncharacterized cupin superfamily protein
MIKITKPTKEELDKLGVLGWPIWEKEVSKFPWHYDDKETCYILEGEVIVTPDNGDPVTIKAGDMVVFPKNMGCTWDIKTAIRKHFNFG